jgi:hypothetical protein
VTAESFKQLGADQNAHQWKRVTPIGTRRRVLENALKFAERESTHWVGYVEAGYDALPAVWFCMREKEGDLQRAMGDALARILLWAAD